MRDYEQLQSELKLLGERENHIKEQIDHDRKRLVQLDQVIADYYTQKEQAEKDLSLKRVELDNLNAELEISRENLSRHEQSQLAQEAEKMQEEIYKAGARKKAAEIAPERPEMWGNLGITLFNASRFEEATDALSKSISLDSNVAIIWSYLGLANFTMKKYDDAIPPLEKADELTPGDARILVNLGSCYQAANRIEEALVTFRKAKQYADKYPGLSQQVDTILRALEKRGDTN